MSTPSTCCNLADRSPSPAEPRSEGRAAWQPRTIPERRPSIRLRVELPNVVLGPAWIVGPNVLVTLRGRAAGHPAAVHALDASSGEALWRWPVSATSAEIKAVKPALGREPARIVIGDGPCPTVLAIIEEEPVLEPILAWHTRGPRLVVWHLTTPSGVIRWIEGPSPDLDLADDFLNLRFRVSNKPRMRTSLSVLPFEKLARISPSGNWIVGTHAENRMHARCTRARRFRALARDGADLRRLRTFFDDCRLVPSWVMCTNAAGIPLWKRPFDADVPSCAVGDHVVCIVQARDDGTGALEILDRESGTLLSSTPLTGQADPESGPAKEGWPSLVAVDPVHILLLEGADLVCRPLSEPGAEAWRLPLACPTPAVTLSEGEILVAGGQSVVRLTA